jgi:CPA1 family monovalent cation:H+ antiporter
VEPRPSWQTVFLVAWSGMRGVVSLASALAIPLTVSSGYDFRHRNLILFITFVVILFTLVLQGLSLKPLIRILKIEEPVKETEQNQNLAMRVQLAEAVLSYMDTNYEEEVRKHDAYQRVRDRYDRMIETAKKKLETDEEAQDPNDAFLPRYRAMLLELVDVRRKELNRFRRTREYNEEVIRDREWELDLEEARLRSSY